MALIYSLVFFYSTNIYWEPVLYQIHAKFWELKENCRTMFLLPFALESFLFISSIRLRKHTLGFQIWPDSCLRTLASCPTLLRNFSKFYFWSFWTSALPWIFTSLVSAIFSPFWLLHSFTGWKIGNRQGGRGWLNMLSENSINETKCSCKKICFRSELPHKSRISFKSKLVLKLEMDTCNTLRSVQSKKKYKILLHGKLELLNITIFFFFLYFIG